MNVYDFDGTIYKKDSSVEFYKYIAKRYPRVAGKCIIPQIVAIMKYKMHLISKEKMKEIFFSFLKYVDTEPILNQFVNIALNDITPWYVKQKRNDDVIVSASPRFLVEKFALHLNIKNVIASEVNIKTGKFESKNCYGQEKVTRFTKNFPNTQIDGFYSDSESDLPLALIAKHAYIVKRNEPQKWDVHSF